MTGASALCGWGTCSARWSWVQAEGSIQWKRYQTMKIHVSLEVGAGSTWSTSFFFPVFLSLGQKNHCEWFWWRLISILVVDLWSRWNIAHTYLIHLTTHGGWWPLQTCWFQACILAVETPNSENEAMKQVKFNYWNHVHVSQLFNVAIWFDIFPGKQTCPLKINGWKLEDVFHIQIVPF